MYNSDECFLTGTAAEIVPVVNIDGRKIGRGKPGPVTKMLLEEFRETEKQEKEICPNCGLSYLDFKKQGKFGCSRCYDVFKPKILPLLQKIHGSIQHRGKYPSIKEYRHLSLRQKIESLKEYLARAVKLEEYEEAARLRDQIRELEKKIQKDKGNV